MTDPVELRREAEDILSGREFQEPRESIADRVFEWIGDRFADIFDRVFQALPGGTGSIVSRIVVVVVAALFLWILWRSVSRWRVPAPIPEDPLSTHVLAARGVDDWLAEADRATAAGRFDEAVRAYYRAAMTGQIDAGRIHDEPGATAREWQRALERAEFADIDAVRDLTATFEEVWFGGRHADEGVADAARTGVRRLVGSRR